MEKKDIKNFKVAKRYSNALYETAKDSGLSSEIFDNLNDIVKTFDNNIELNNFLINPLVSLADKKEVIKQIFNGKINEISENFLLLLLDNDRIDSIRSVLNDYEIRFDRDMNIDRPVITSALELDFDTKNRIINKLEEKLSAKVIPVFQVEPEIIGGLIVEARDKTVDLSLRTKFNNMKKQLTKG